jgi:hypothetical protein
LVCAKVDTVEAYIAKVNEYHGRLESKSKLKNSGK